jgi:citrate lyase subunit beta/citryl-CoA lyase
VVADTTPAAGTVGERPVRSLLFVPGNRSRWFQPAIDSGTDGIIIDLQDAVPAGERKAALAAVGDLLDAQAGKSGPVLLVRVGAIGSAALAEDLAATVRPGLDGVVLPMVTGPDDVRRLVTQLESAEQEGGIAQPLRVMPLLETAAALVRCFEIASCTERVAYLGGATAREGDLARSLGFQWTPEGDETLYLRSHALLHARAAGVRNPVSGMWGQVGDLPGLRAFAEQTRRLGYRGMMVIHPSHVSVVNEVFSPSPADIARWRAVIDQLAELESRGLGTGTVDGQLIDAAHATTARDELDRARALGLV